MLHAASEVGVMGMDRRRTKVAFVWNPYLDGERIDAVIQGG
jgi:hypothetical protein